MQEIKDDLIWHGEDKLFYADHSLYIEYTDGTSICVFEGDPVKKLKKSGIRMLVFEADWGTQFYNAFPQLDESYPDNPMIRIGIQEGEHGPAVNLEKLVVEIQNAKEENEAQVEKRARKAAEPIPKKKNMVIVKFFYTKCT